MGGSFQAVQCMCRRYVIPVVDLGSFVDSDSAYRLHDRVTPAPPKTADRLSLTSTETFLEFG